jgi:hypothetical protein
VALEVGYHYDFGKLKSGDRFAMNGLEYEKLSGNFADRLYGGKIDETKPPVEIPAGTTVYLYQLY